MADQQSGVLGLLPLFLKASPYGSMHVTLWMLLDFQNLNFFNGNSGYGACFVKFLMALASSCQDH